jgi:hemerythrin-like domain-containing protein
VAPISPSDFLKPIVFFDHEHQRQSVAYGILKALADDPFSSSAREDAAAVLTCLTEHLPVHIKDEEEDLMPALEKRCAGDAHFEAVRDQLHDEHEIDDAWAASLIFDLRSLVDGKGIENPAAFAAMARAFAEMQQRHLAWEDRTLLPMAQEHLAKDDLEKIGRGMAARRGIAYPR